MSILLLNILINIKRIDDHLGEFQVSNIYPTSYSALAFPSVQSCPLYSSFTCHNFEEKNIIVYILYMTIQYLKTLLFYPLPPQL